MTEPKLDPNYDPRTDGAMRAEDQKVVRPRDAATLIIVRRDGAKPRLLMGRRNKGHSFMPGKWVFPGGRIDPDDAHPEAAALREAQEEIALDPASVEVVGRMEDYVTGTGYRITPVLGLLPPDLLYRPSPHEVEAVFELPLHVLLDPDAPRRQRQHVRGEWREYWVWPHPEHFIWGATAAILVHLARKLRSAGLPC